MGVSFESKMSKAPFPRMDGAAEGGLNISLGVDLVPSDVAYNVALPPFTSSWGFLVVRFVPSSVAAADCHEPHDRRASSHHASLRHNWYS